ncbi:MAG TPA: AI-2E family transporter, partial [Planctomycetaceae bacterium]
MTRQAGAATPRAQTIIAWAAGLALLYWAKAILIPIALAVLLTFLLAPLVTRLQRLGAPKVLAVTAVVAVALLAAVVVGYAVSRQVAGLAGELAGEDTRDRILRKVDRLKERWGSGGGTLDRLAELFDSVRDQIEGDALPTGDTADDGPGTVAPGPPEPAPLAVRVEPEESTLAENFRTLIAPLLGPLG